MVFLSYKSDIVRHIAIMLHLHIFCLLPSMEVILLPAAAFERDYS